MSGCLFALALLFFFIGIVQLFRPAKNGKPHAGTGDMIQTLTNSVKDALRPSGSSYPATPRSSSHRPPAPSSPPTPQTEVKSTVNTSSPFNRIQVGDRIAIPHPQMGPLTLFVTGKVVFQELWQTSRSSGAPWVPTGNAFTAYFLETNRVLLNWQTRYYLLDEAVPLSDAEIQRDFAPYAKQFAQSNQTADVYFAYPPASWHIDDIGKFRVQSVEGSGSRQSQGGIGRFVHASGDSDRALVLEDYEGGGGQDMVWIGYKIDETDIQAA